MLSSLQLCVLIPVFNDWSVVEILTKHLDTVLSDRGLHADLVLIDDGSTAIPSSALTHNPQALRKVEIVTLRKNMGHQRALSVGLVYVHKTRPGATVVIMDADGEDNPLDVITLLERYCELDGERVVFAARAKRAEGLVFRLFYRMFQLVHYSLVGFGTQVGNFSVIPPAILDRLVIVPEIWNHYAAAVVKSRFPIDHIGIARSRRLLGQSKMSLVQLIIHGLSAISVYGDAVGVRLVLAFSALSALCLAALVVMLAIRFGTTMMIPWPGHLHRRSLDDRVLAKCPHLSSFHVHRSLQPRLSLVHSVPGLPALHQRDPHCLSSPVRGRGVPLEISHQNEPQAVAMRPAYHSKRKSVPPRPARF